MTTTPHRYKKIMIVGKRDRGDDIGRSRAAGDERRPLVDHAIPDLACLIISISAGEEQFATQAGL
jgi:hypothetical protein